MHCTEGEGQRREADGVRRTMLLQLGALTAVLAGCAAQKPAAPPLPPPPPAPAPRPAAAPAAAVPAPPPAAPAPAPASRRGGPSLGPMVVLAPPQPARNWNDFKKAAAQRMVLASPNFAYMGKPPPMLFGIPILEIELNADGSVRDISVVRPPANIDAADTVDIAKEAVMRAAPFGDISRLPRPWKWTEVFLFNDKRAFKPRTLD